MLYPLFAATIFVSSFLLFLIQPMMAKLLLPSVGGAPSVWNTAMAFYQITLLAGYAYAHLVRRLLSPMHLGVLHIVLLLLALLVLPISIGHGLNLDPTASPIRWLLLTLALSIGLPFLLLSSHAPLLQHFFSHAAHPAAKNPYLLYAASNAGSLLGLFAYPLIGEPFFAVPEQTLVWSIGYGVLILMIAGCLWRLRGNYVPFPDSEEELGGIPLKTCLYWMLLAFVPSSLLLGVTSYITTDIAAVPLLWVLPLALYLITFILVFGERMRGYRLAVMAQAPLVLIVAFFTCFGLLEHTTSLMVIHLMLFFATAMVCHGRLAQSRPAPRHLTTFYLCMSLGGALGGSFNALLAPVLFNDVYEYVLVLVIALLLRPGIGPIAQKERVKVILWPVLLLVGFLLINKAVLYFDAHFPAVPHVWERLFGKINANWARASIVAFGALTCVAALMSRRQPLTLVLIVATLYFFNYALFAESQRDRLFTARNFFGVSRVGERRNPDMRYYMHGTTLHGIQPTDEALRLSLTSYYYPFNEIAPKIGMKTHRVAVAGLGIGTLACSFGRDVTIDMYEIDPIVVALAEDSRYFTYMRDCPPKKKVILGDARLKLAQEPDGRYDLIVLDVYSSDSLPIHILTREAIAMYASKLTDDGMLAFNLSNRHLQLTPIVANITDSLDMYAIQRLYLPGTEEKFSSPAQWMLVGKQRWSVTPFLTQGSGWEVSVAPDSRPWTDNYSNVVEALRYRYLPLIKEWLAPSKAVAPAP